MAKEWLRKAGVTLADATHGVPLLSGFALTSYYRALLYLLGGEYEKAVADFSEAIRLREGFDLAHANRGLAYQRLRLHGLALADFQKFLNLARTTRAHYRDIGQVHCNRGISYKLLGELDRALDEFGLALKCNSRLATAYAARGIVYQAMRQPVIAMRDLNDALRLEPNDADYLSCRGYVHFQTRDFTAAVADLSRSVALGGDIHATLFHYLARARLGQDGRAELAARSIKLEGTGWPWPVIPFLLGRTTTDWLLDKAGDEAEKAEAAFYIGQWHLLRGEIDEALPWFGIAEKGCAPPYIERTIAIIERERATQPAA